jgi:phosphotransferase system enzyme I (PtsI)
VVIAGKQAGIPVAVCGEMAGDPLCVSMLLGLGIGELSMTTRAIPVIKKLIRSISLKEAHEDFHNMAGLSTAREMRAYILDRMKKLLPELDEKGYLNT